MLSITDINLLQSQNEGLRKQNEELQKENKYLKEYKRKSVTCQECYDEGYNVGKFENKELNRYSKALDKIKDIITPVANKNGVYNCWTLLNSCDKCLSKKDCGTQSPYFVAKQILDIINKVKEGNNAN